MSSEEQKIEKDIEFTNLNQTDADVSDQEPSDYEYTEKEQYDQNLSLVEKIKMKYYRFIDFKQHYYDIKQYIKREFRNLYDPAYQPIPTMLYQRENEGNCFKKKLTPNQQIFLGSLLNFTILYTFIVFVIHECDSDSDDQCMDFIYKHLKVQVFQMIFMSILVVLTFFLALRRTIPRYFIIYLILILMILCFFQYPLDLKQTTVKSYGSVQAIGLIVFITMAFSITFTVKFLIFLWRKARFVIYGLLLSILGLYIAYKVISHGSCKGWELGLTGKIDYGNPYCKINKPEVCYPNIVDGLFNFGPNTCDSKLSEQEAKIKVLSNYLAYNMKDKEEIMDVIKDAIDDDNYSFLGQPLTTKFNYRQRIYDVVQENMVYGSKFYKTKEEAIENGHEIIINTNKYEMEINIKRNETLVEERKKEVEGQNIESIAKNVIIIYVDTVSRAQAHRKLPQTMKFLKQFVGEDNPTDKELFEFYRFHSLDKLTKNNALILHYDTLYEDYYADTKKFEKEFTQKPKPNLVKEFKDAGFIVGHSANTCTSECLFRLQYQDMRPFFNEEAADHEMTMWDPSYINPNNYYDLQQGPNSIKRRCMYNDDTAYHVFNYGEQFLDAYKQDKKVLMMEFTDSHELTSEVIQYMDDDIVNFLQSSQDKGHLDDDTVVYLMSDHGQHIIQTFYKIELPVKENDWDQILKKKTNDYGNHIYDVERMLPIFQMVMSKSIFKKYEGLRETLEHNSQIVFGFREGRRTLLSTTYGLNDPRFEDSLYHKLRKNRDCRDIGMRPILHHAQFCQCRPNFKYLNEEVY